MEIEGKGGLIIEGGGGAKGILAPPPPQINGGPAPPPSSSYAYVEPYSTARFTPRPRLEFYNVLVIP